MSKKIKKTIIIVVFSLLIFVGMYIWGYGIFEPEDDNKDDNIKIITENYKTEIIVYGSDIAFDQSCYVRKVDEISKTSLSSEDSFVYTVFIINDLDGTITLTDKDLGIIKGKVFDDKIDFFYFGKNNIKKIINAGIFSQDVAEEEMSLGVIYERGIKTDVLGTWTEEAHKYYKEKNPGLLAENIIDEIVSKIRFDNK